MTKQKLIKWILIVVGCVLVLLFADGILGAYYHLKWNETVKDYEETRQQQEKKYQSDQTFYQRVDSLIDQKQYEMVIRIINSRIEDYPEDVESLIIEKGNLYYNTGQLDSALKHYSIVVSRTPHNLLARSNRGWVYMKQQLYDLAIADFKYCSEINFDYHFDLAHAYEESGHLEQALASYENFLEHYPDNIESSTKRDSINEILKTVHNSGQMKK
jgi:tetratricopeptide (TPR) repeat protein